MISKCLKDAEEVCMVSKCLKDVEAGEEKDSNDEKKSRSSWKSRDPPKKDKTSKRRRRIKKKKEKKRRASDSSVKARSKDGVQTRLVRLRTQDCRLRKSEIPDLCVCAYEDGNIESPRSFQQTHCFSIALRVLHLNQRSLPCNGFVPSRSCTRKSKIQTGHVVGPLLFEGDVGSFFMKSRLALRPLL